MAAHTCARGHEHHSQSPSPDWACPSTSISGIAQWRGQFPDRFWKQGFKCDLGWWCHKYFLYKIILWGQQYSSPIFHVFIPSTSISETAQWKGQSPDRFCNQVCICHLVCWCHKYLLKTSNDDIILFHSPAPVYQKQPNGEDNFQTGSVIKVETVFWFYDVTCIYSTKLNCDIISIHSPAPVYQKQSNGEDNFQTGSESKVESVFWFDDVKSIYFKNIQ